MHHKPKSTVAEAFRGLADLRALFFSRQPPETMLVTSFIPKEGKTFIAANLALVIAYSGESVLLIDADMRKPSMHKIFDLDNREGLSNVIVGEEPAIHRSVLHEKLDIMTCGPVPPNPAELFGSKRMAEFHAGDAGKIRQDGLDSPPVGSVTDAVVLEQTCRQRALCGAWRRRRRGRLPRGRPRLMRDVDAKMMGAVLNNIDIGRESYYYSHYYHYYYHYYHYYGHDGDGKRLRAVPNAAAGRAEEGASGRASPRSVFTGRDGRTRRDSV